MYHYNLKKLTHLSRQIRKSDRTLPEPVLWYDIELVNPTLEMTGYNDRFMRIHDTDVRVKQRKKSVLLSSEAR